VFLGVWEQRENPGKLGLPEEREELDLVEGLEERGKLGLLEELVELVF
jgi:hypothetical protein